MQTLQANFDSVTSKLKAEEEQRIANARKWESMVAELKSTKQQLEVAETRTSELEGAHAEALRELSKSKDIEHTRVVAQFQVCLKLYCYPSSIN